MKQIPAAKFKEQCLSLLDRVGEEGIVITKRGKPVAKLIPIRTESAELSSPTRSRSERHCSLNFAAGICFMATS